MFLSTNGKKYFHGAHAYSHLQQKFQKIALKIDSERTYLKYKKTLSWRMTFSVNERKRMQVNILREQEIAKPRRQIEIMKRIELS